ncbi:putative galacturonosyltransferase 3 [Camellia lanceoleosa]|uniref:Galacturonosyltransferase 3 n=1 Tax=Camellia lanceoleosa TaxID=1840588 RepID=A0ACC0ISX2_9ERIC|nr:putative galacturonosyltransferase 3 [Camellia lanceoleosa]
MKILWTHLPIILFVIFLVMIHVALAGADLLDTQTVQRDLKTYWPLYDCPQCIGIKEQGHMKSASGSNPPDEKDIDIIVTYSDTSGSVRIRTVKSRDLSASWVWRSPTDENIDQPKSSQTLEESFQADMRFEDDADHSTDEHQSGGEIPQPQTSTINPVKLKRLMLRQRRRDLRAAELIRQDKEIDNQMHAAVIDRARELDTTVKGKYSIWRKEYENPNSDSTLKLMRDQIIMAKLYASIAKAKNESGLYDSLIKHSRANHYAIGDASSDAELQPSALDQAKAMGHILSIAKDQFYDCLIVMRKLRAMLQSTELNLTTDYYLQSYENKGFPNKDKLEDTSLYHYAIFSDNVLAASVVVNSRYENVVSCLPSCGAAIQVENVDDFTWLNSSYCPVLRQLESARMKEYYFKANQASSLSVGSDNLKYRNPKYLSMLNHLRFYLPEVYPKLDKILFLDDDIVVQKDLTPLWSVNLEGMVNGAVETCKESFHRFDKYLNFSNPKISDNFDANACGWAFGMNIFDLKEWRKQDITGIYHRWQNMNEDRTLWKLGTLPPGLITFYKLMYPLERSWHVLGLGYDPALNKTEIENAAVIHYNGNNKPWLDLAISKYKSYWSRYVMFDNSYLRACNINE